MDYFSISEDNALKHLSVDKHKGLNDKQIEFNREKFGKNVLTKKKKQSIFSKIFSCLKEPMLLILLFGFVLALGVNLGKYFKTGSADFAECFGILFAVILSVTITLVMEGGSERAFSMLNNIYDNLLVKVLRNGKVINVLQKDIVVGDIILIESGDKIVADGRLIESISLSVDESALTGESVSVEKSANLIYSALTPLAERKNMVYSGTFVTAGSGTMIVTAVGDRTEIGGIASEIGGENSKDTPLQQKLAKLGKTITIIGASCAVLVFILSIIKLYLIGGLTFNSVQELFVSCIILIVAAVPEGLPTIVAVSLALNMIKLAKQNALIKKMTATETAGAVSVICSDKTGTLTQNKMSVVNICTGEFCGTNKSVLSTPLAQNFVCNSTAEINERKNKKASFSGSGTECALLTAYALKNKENYKVLRDKYKIVKRQPFSSENKYMYTTIKFELGYRKLVKGAPEILLDKCDLTGVQKSKILEKMQSYQKKAQRILCFAHLDYKEGEKEDGKLIYDGFVTLADPVRPEVKKSVQNCKRAGIDVKMLTGDNRVTAFAIAKELNITNDESRVINGYDIEKLDDESLKKILPKIAVIARSTPLIKLRVVKLLKEMGEVVAVTGDGINDAPAIKHADVGFAMGESGTEITKEVADVVLLDDSFDSVVKAIAFGRNVYRNLQRFILFQLSVNLSALFFITVCAIMGLPTPFNTFQLLWINVIMDGPPALTLGLESVGQSLMKHKPVKRFDGIVNKSMFFRILFNGLFVGIVILMQYLYNFLGASINEESCCIFTLFILFQLFNAFNSRELGATSIFKNFTKNKIMVITFAIVFIVHFLIVQFLPVIFGVEPMSFALWGKCILTASSIVLVSELYKLIYRKTKGNYRLFSKEKARNIQ